MDADVSARLHCSIHYALDQRFMHNVLSACNRGEFYEARSTFSVWRIVALAVDFRPKAALRLLERLEEATSPAGLFQLPLHQIRLALLALWGRHKYANRRATRGAALVQHWCMCVHQVYKQSVRLLQGGSARPPAAENKPRKAFSGERRKRWKQPTDSVGPAAARRPSGSYSTPSGNQIHASLHLFSLSDNALSPTTPTAGLELRSISFDTPEASCLPGILCTAMACILRQ